MFRRVLIANRGEIAQRVIRACRELGIETVAVYSTADADALYLREADQTICIGPPPGKHSYLSIPSIIAAAEVADVEAIHPGYGFLSENDHFAEVCRSCKIHFIGPEPETIALLGDKVAARELAKRAGVPVVPGSDGPVEDEARALSVAAKIGYPIMIKAAAGGGGRGMRIARNEPSLVTGFHAARAEAQNAFGDGTVYLEKLVENPRHVEVQILADKYGTVLHLGERDCSIQRRHQKLIEESPSAALTPQLRQQICDAAVRVAYRGVLLHRGQLPHPGRAPRDRAGHWHRFGATAAPDRRGRAAAAEAVRHRVPRPRHRMPYQRRGPGKRFPTLARAHRFVCATGGAGGATRQSRLQRLPNSAELRFDDRKTLGPPP